MLTNHCTCYLQLRVLRTDWYLFKGAILAPCGIKKIQLTRVEQLQRDRQLIH